MWKRAALCAALLLALASAARAVDTAPIYKDSGGISRDAQGVFDMATPVTSRSGTITAGGTAQQIMAANTLRVEAFVFNPDATEALWINIAGGTAAANAAGSIYLPPLGGWSGKITNAISGVAATTGHKFTAGER